MRVRVWDLPTRLFHWTLAVLVVFSFVTGKLGAGWMAWHVKSGYAILALLAFRLGWGVVGSDTARFSRFVRGWRAGVDYGRTLLAGAPTAFTGHNPLGGWMVLAMLAALSLQAVTGLFADDEVRTQGPLAASVAESTVRLMTRIHSWNEWFVVALVAVHVVAIATYQWGLRRDLVGPMVHGMNESASAPRMAATAWAVAVLAAAVALVYYVVVIYPAAP